MTEPVVARQARRRDQLHAAWEAFIVLLVCINLSLILFDSLFALQPVSAVLADLAPELHARYQQSVHANFQYIDLGFVAIFVLDVLLGWTVALFERRYARWYYYPFAHWYDVLGCIPLAGLRWLRVLRVGALLIRLQRLGLIDMRGWAIYGLFSRYYYLLIEELSDRVMVRLFGRLQQEIGASDDLSRRLLQEVVRPRKQRLLNDISRRLQDMLETGYRDNRGAIEGYVSQLIHQALQNNPEMAISPTSSSMPGSTRTKIPTWRWKNCWSTSSKCSSSRCSTAAGVVSSAPRPHRHIPSERTDAMLSVASPKGRRRRVLTCYSSTALKPSGDFSSRRAPMIISVAQFTRIEV